MEDPAFQFTMTATIACEKAVLDFQLGRTPELLVRRDGAEHAVHAGRTTPSGPATTTKSRPW